MICPLCNKDFKQITKQHIHFKHNMTMEEFKLQFPQVDLSNHGTVSTVQRKIDDKIIEYNNDPLLCKCCKKPLSYNQSRNGIENNYIPLFCSRSCAAKINNLGRIQTQITKDKIGNSLKEYQSKIQHTPLIKPEYIQVEKSKIYYGSCKICGKNFIGRSNKKHCSKICQNKTHSNIAIRSELGGNHNHWSCWYNSNIAGKVHLESSWELKLAKLFDENNMNWCRPSYIPWIDNDNISHRYYPDFYLFEYGIYVEPKNTYLLEKDTDKLKYVVNKYGITIIVISDPSGLNLENIMNNLNNKGLIIT